MPNVVKKLVSVYHLTLSTAWIGNLIEILKLLAEMNENVCICMKLKWNQMPTRPLDSVIKKYRLSRENMNHLKIGT